MLYIQKNTTVEAVQWNKVGDHSLVLSLTKEIAITLSNWSSCNNSLLEEGKLGIIKLVNGSYFDVVRPGDYVITSPSGFVHCMSKMHFENTYLLIGEKLNWSINKKLEIESDNKQISIKCVDNNTDLDDLPVPAIVTSVLVCDLLNKHMAS